MRFQKIEDTVNAGESRGFEGVNRVDLAAFQALQSEEAGLQMLTRQFTNAKKGRSFGMEGGGGSRFGRFNFPSVINQPVL